MKWKQEHSDFISIINSNEITLFVETWLGNKECELLSQHHRDKFTIFYMCRRKSQQAKRNSGGLMVFVKNSVSKYITIAQQSNEDIIWLKLSTLLTNYSHDTYLCCTYVSPKGSSRLICADMDKLELIYNDILNYKSLGYVAILGDLNSRIGTLQDYVNDNIVSDVLYSEKRQSNCRLYGE